MAQVNNPVSGVSYLFKALPLLSKPGIKPFVIIPLIINIVVFSVAIYFGFVYFAEYMNKLLDTSKMWGWVAAIVGFIRPLLYMIFGLALLVIIFYTFAILANVIASPFNSLLAEATERYLTGKTDEQSDSIKQVAKELIPTIWMEIKKLLYMIIWSIPLLILFFIPVVNLVAPFLWFLFSAWMMSLQYMDYPMGNHKMKFKQQRSLQANKRMLTLGFGGVTMGASMVPIINFIIMPTAVIAATILWVEQYAGTDIDKV